MSELAQKACGPCRGDVPPLKGVDLQAYQEQLGGTWRVIDEHHLENEYKFKDFAEALAFVNKVGALAESADHHPDIEFGWGRAKITLWTHKIGGLSENDFIMAAKIDELKSRH